MTWKLGLVEWQVDEAPPTWENWRTRLEQSIADGAAQGASLLVYPEYASLELAGCLPAVVRRHLRKQIKALQELREAFLATHVALAAQYGVTLLTGSYPWQVDGGRFRNRVWLIEPDGTQHHRDKTMMTRFERELFGIEGGQQGLPVEMALGRVGVLICYDVEFPLLARGLVERGSDLLLTPSCTDTAAGWYRVRTGARARALENQCLVGQAPLVGKAPWNPAIDENVGQSALFCPPDRSFPEDGIMAQASGLGGTLYHEIDLERVRWVRKHGQVLTLRDWDEHCRLALPALEQPS